MSHISRRHLIQATGLGLTATAVRQSFALTGAPVSTVSIQRCRDYNEFADRLTLATQQIGGIGRLVRGKTVALKLNLTGNPDNFPVDPKLPFRNDPQSVAATVHLLAQAGARRVRILESFFPARHDLSLWARYGLDVNAIGNLGTKVEWENIQNLGSRKDYVRLKVPWGGYAYPAYTVSRALVDCDVYCSLAKLKNHWVAGVTLSMKNNFGNTPCSLYGGDCGPSGNENPTQERVKVMHEGVVRAPSGVDAELHPLSPRDPGYRVPRVAIDQVGIRPIDLAIIDGVETVRGGEGAWNQGIERLTPGVIVVGRNPVCTDAVATAVMSYDPRASRGQSAFIRGDNSLLLAERAGIGSADLNRIEIAGLPLAEARVPFGPGAVGKTLSQLRTA